MTLINTLIQRLGARLFPSVPALHLPPPTEAQAKPAEPPALAAPKWQALPGNVIELGASGFQIVLDVGSTRPLYTLRAPEGFSHAWGFDLPALKALGERLASEREEFVCRAEGWKP